MINFNQENQQYFYQVKLEMFTTTPENYDFMVWTPKEFVIIKIPRMIVKWLPVTLVNWFHLKCMVEKLLPTLSMVWYCKKCKLIKRISNR